MGDEALQQLTAGRAALARGAWSEARAYFESAASLDDSAEAAEGLSWAAWWLEDVEVVLEARERAYLGYREAGNSRAAARMALWLGDDHVEFRGAHAVAAGWLGRAASILEGLSPCEEHGWLALFEAHAALGRDEPDQALGLAKRARALGREHGAPDLELFSRATEGVTRVAQADVAGGLQALDEAAAAALAGEFENLVPAAWTCCLVMATCEQIRDHERAAQWCAQIERFSARMDARFLRGACRAHDGLLRSWRGSWEQAEGELVAALDALTANRPKWRDEALVRLGLLRRRQGRRTEATRLFDEASGHPLAVIGRAALCLDGGDARTAKALLERSLRQAPPERLTGRADALELLVRASVALGDVADAETAAVELRGVADTIGTPALLAAAQAADGLLAAARGDVEVACHDLEDAADRFLRCGAPVEAARTRIDLGRALTEAGRRSEASDEVRLALAHLGTIETSVEHDEAHALLARLAAHGELPPRRDTILTDRQVEVLRLVAEGLSDRDIADRLVLSPHTVHRHMANIYTRLGCSSRPAAVAAASRLGLLTS